MAQREVNEVSIAEVVLVAELQIHHVHIVSARSAAVQDVGFLCYEVWCCAHIVAVMVGSDGTAVGTAVHEHA